MDAIKKHFVLIILFLIISLIPVIFLNTTLSMIKVWTVNETFTHGFLIFPISLWLIWQKRHILLEMPPSPEPKVFILLVSTLILWFISSIVDVFVTQQLSMVAIVITLIWLVLGRDIVKYISFPLLFLFFAVPLGQELIPVLMEFTANFTVYLIQLTGIPIYRDGLFFTLPTGNWSVVEECSGVRYLIASVALGTIYAYLNYSSLNKRLAFILVSIVVPIFANGFRAFGIVMIGHLSGMELAVGADHLLYGWFFFGIVIFVMFYIGSFWWDYTEDKPKIATFKNSFLSLKQSTVFLTTGIILTLFTQLYASHKNTTEYDNQKQITLNMPENFNAWQFDSDRLLNWKPILKLTNVTISKGYRFADELVQLDIGFYFQQNRGAEAVSSNNRLTNPYGDGWKITAQTDYQQESIYVSEVEIRNNDKKLLIWQWYRIGDLQTPNPYIAKVFDAYNKIFTGRTDASFITIATTLGEDKGLSQKRLTDFLSNSLTDINKSLEKATNQ
ncbi:MAG: exosortase A [Deltaproteobacteria bacterium]|nr:exosortase A [Deltaproteobacteria bacterium]